MKKITLFIIDVGVMEQAMMACDMMNKKIFFYEIQYYMHIYLEMYILVHPIHYIPITTIIMLLLLDHITIYSKDIIKEIK